MDKTTYKEVDEAIDVISNVLGVGIYFAAGMKIADSNIKPFWKVLCIDLALLAIRKCTAQSRKIMEKNMNDGFEYIKKVK